MKDVLGWIVGAVAVAAVLYVVFALPPPPEHGEPPVYIEHIFVK